MKINSETIPDDEELLEAPTVEVDGKEFNPFASDGEFWAMLDAIEQESIKDYKEKKSRSEEAGVNDAELSE